jgi:hypothetical protein
MKTLDRYNVALLQILPPGSGCHVSLLSVANLGTLAGVNAEQIFQDIRGHIPRGKRRIPDREITDAIGKAVADHNGGTFRPRSRITPIVKDSTVARQRIIDQGPYRTAEELIKVSPVTIPEDPKLHTKLLIETRYQHNELIFNGERHQPGILGDTIRPAVGWSTHLIEDGKTAPFIIINPLTGLPAPKKSGEGVTYRGDGNVKEFRFCLAEFDNLSLEEQIRFWSAIKLPIVALIDSGGKSIHAWLQVSKIAPVMTSEQWQSVIKSRLYDRLLRPMGVDTACCNPARLSRLPGHYREDRQKYQSLLWLSPEGRPICQ